MKKQAVNTHISFEKGVRNIYQASAYIILAGNLLDLMEFARVNVVLLYSNLITVAIILIFLAGYYLRRISCKTSFTVLIYTILANLYIGKFLSNFPVESPERVYFFLRDSLFTILLLALASFALNKIHAIIIGGSHLVVMVAIALILNNVFLNESLILVVVVSMGYTGLIYYLVGLFDKALLHEREDSRLIQSQNEILNEANSLLEERQQRIEEQAEAIRNQSLVLEQQAEELQQKNEALSQMNASKDRFFSIIAHDLKNPFHLILGYSSLLRQKYRTLTDEKRTHYIGHIEDIATKTYTLLENLLSWARSQTNSIKMYPESISMNELVSDILELYREQAENKLLTVEYSPDKEFKGYADKEMIGTVIRNLISNAVKFSREKGTIRIDMSENHERVTFCIEDNGVGISEENMAGLFNINKHLSTPGTLNETGSGLGLILCREFIDKNHGEISVESKENEGSIFTFKIPVSSTR